MSLALINVVVEGPLAMFAISDRTPIASTWAKKKCEQSNAKEGSEWNSRESLDSLSATYVNSPRSGETDSSNSKQITYEEALFIRKDVWHAQAIIASLLPSVGHYYLVGL